MKTRLIYVITCLLLVLSTAGCGVFFSRGPGAEADPYQSGLASWYGKKFHGRKTASGSPYDMGAMTAAHKTLPFGTKVKVVEVKTGNSVVVTINDRGPFVENRVIDLSKEAAKQLGIIEQGHAKVELYRLE